MEVVVLTPENKQEGVSICFDPLKCLYQRFHPSRVMGWWLVLLVNYAVIGNLK